jgi:predicted DNA-binding transcriptional regulator AlpA
MSAQAQSVPPPSGGQKCLLPKQVSQKIKVSESTLAKWRLNGNGPKFVKIGGKVVYRESDVERFLEAHLCQSTSEYA